MNWMKLKDIQNESNRIGRPICAWTPKIPNSLEPPNSSEREYVIDKGGKPGDGNYPKEGMKEKEHCHLQVFQPHFSETKVGPPIIEVMELVDCQSRSKNPAKVKFRTMTLEEAKTLSYDDHIWFIRNDGKAGQLKINGQPKTWKRTPNRVSVPIKYGMYEYSYFTEQDLHRMLIKLEG